MKRVLAAGLATLLAAGAAAGAAEGVQGYPFFMQTLPGTVQQDGDAKWQDEVTQMTSGDCARRAPPKVARADLADCLSGSMKLKSLAQQVMRCRMSIELDRPDDSGRKRIETSTLIGPGEERWGAHSLGPHGIQVVGFSSHCVTLPREPANELELPAGCAAEVSGPEPKGEEYPKGIWRNQLDGRTILEYQVNKSGRMDDVQVVGSSGSAFVDDAAVWFAQQRLRVKTNCPAQRFRYTVTFNLADAPPPPRTIWVN